MRLRVSQSVAWGAEMVAIWRGAEVPRKPSPVKRVLRTENCQDEDGNRYTVIVWRDWPGLSTVSYSLEDGTPVHYEDECYFTTPDGKMLTRCED